MKQKQTNKTLEHPQTVSIRNRDTMEQFVKSRSYLLNLQLYRDTKSTFRIVLCLLLFSDVYGAERHKIKAVSVKEGESVALLGETEIQIGDELLWMFGNEGELLAKINTKNKIFEIYDSDDGRFEDRLELDHQNGSLIIRDSKTTDSGVYTMKIINKRATIYKRFCVTVSDAFGAETDQTKAISVKEGEDVALRTGETEIQTEDDILWVFGDVGEIIAEINLNVKIFKTYDGDDGRFRDRLELDRYTGSLIIRNSKTTDSGVYTVKIINKRATIYKRFCVTVSENLLHYMKIIVSNILLLGWIGCVLKRCFF
uniref:Immunoglobulin domain-containing protein n=1 Tax=Cyprinus carpio TaxID=7962 RepID=A0A8C1V183_CYPCA